VPIYLIRHAHAGSRPAWRGEDAARPLSAKGIAQAEAINRALRHEPIRRIASSPAVRCIETVAPLADRLGLRVERRDQLFEGGDADEVLALLLSWAKRNPAVSSHGDLIPKIVRRLIASGMKTKDANISQKGSVWVLEVDGGKVVKGRYVPPPR